MKILHYSLGFPPYRSGGLTKFCMDLMIQQKKEGNHVSLMWPGKMSFISKKVDVKNRGFAEFDGNKIQSFEIINPLPISYDEGISEFNAFTKDISEDVYQDFLCEYKPDVIHIHTLMGLHKSFLSEAKKLGIKIVFTAHDFFPICSKVTMSRKGKICDCVGSCEKCGICNTSALSMKKIQILQSPMYRKMKNTLLVKKLRKKHRDEYLGGNCINDNAVPVGTAKNYKQLRAYYGSMLQLMDIIHYNSTITKKIYERYFEVKNECVISITHSDITDNRKIKTFSNNILRIRYLGPNGEGKGFYLLKEALDQLWSQRQDFCLDVHFIPTEQSPYIQSHDRYSYEDLKEIFDNTDVVVTPSIWYETFGFTVLEALSYGVPVIISGTVGAKDILAEGAGIVIENETSNKLYDVIASLNKDKLRAMNKIIVEKQNIMQMYEMSEEIKKQCYL